MTPAGYLLCSDVRIARTGSMLYRPDEVPEVTPAANGQMVVIMRDADVLFDSDAMASFSGMDITDDHPPSLLTPETAGKYSVGTVLNPRRGEGVESEYLIADLLIKNAKTIATVQARKKREVSCGYDADLEEIKPGLGRQIGLVGNHVAIVDRGRAGSSCTIQDKETDMARRKPSMMDRLRKAFKDNDETALETILDDLPDGDGPNDDDGPVVVHIHNAPPAAEAKPAEVATVDDEPNPYEERFKALEDGFSDIGTRLDEIAAKLEPAKPAEVDPVLDEEPTEKEEAKREEVMDAAAKAEIILPGYKIGTMDSVRTGSDLTGIRRDVLTRAFADSARKGAVEAIIGSADLATAKPGQIRTFFDAACAIAKERNNNRRQIGIVPQGPMTAAKLQEQITERRKTRGF